MTVDVLIGRAVGPSIGSEKRQCEGWEKMLIMNRRRQSTVRRIIDGPFVGGHRLKPRFGQTFLIWTPFTLGLSFIINRVKNLVFGLDSFTNFILLFLDICCCNLSIISNFQIWFFKIILLDFKLNFWIFFEFFNLSSWFMIYQLWIVFF